VSASQHHGDVRQTIRAGERVERWLGFHAAGGGPVDAETNIVYVAGGRQLMKGWEERGRRLGWTTSHVRGRWEAIDERVGRKRKALGLGNEPHWSLPSPLSCVLRWPVQGVLLVTEWQPLVRRFPERVHVWASYARKNEFRSSFLRSKELELMKD
jgi:hypothetical protein